MPDTARPISWKTTSFLLVVIALVHVYLTWGHISFHYGDAGRWLNEVQRAVRGQVPYRDFTWGFPPLPLWLLTVVGRIFGTGVASLWGAMVAVFAAIAVLYGIFVHRLIQDSILACCTAITGMFMALGLACIESSPLSAGMYQPGVPIGLLFLLVAAILAVRPLTGGHWSNGTAILTGVSLACAVLSKHDFWVPSVYLLLGLLLVSRQHAVRLLVPFGILIFAALFVVVQTSGWSTIHGLVAGFGILGNFTRARTYPSGERLTECLIASSMLLVAGFASVRAWRALSISSAALFVGLLIYRAFAGRFAGLTTAVEAQIFPVLLPAIVLLSCLCIPDLRLRHVLLLLGFCLTLHARRGFEHSEWFQAMLSVPIYLILLMTAVPRVRIAPVRYLAPLLFVLLLVGADTYRRFAPGWPAHSHDAVSTPRGTVYLLPEYAREYVALDAALKRLDPAGLRRIYSLGMTGGHCYFLGRECALPTDLALAFSHKTPAQLEEALDSDRSVILLDQLTGRGHTMPSPHLSFSWKLATVPSYTTTVDAPILEHRKSGCRLFEKTQRFAVYDCQ